VGNDFLLRVRFFTFLPSPHSYRAAEPLRGPEAQRRGLGQRRMPKSEPRALYSVMMV